MPTTRSKAAQTGPQGGAPGEPASGSKKRTQHAVKGSPKKARKAAAKGEAAAQPSPKAGSKRKAAEPEPEAAAADSGAGQPEQQEKEGGGGAEVEQGGSLPDNVVEEGKVSFMFRCAAWCCACRYWPTLRAAHPCLPTAACLPAQLQQAQGDHTRS